MTRREKAMLEKVTLAVLATPFTKRLRAVADQLEQGQLEAWQVLSIAVVLEMTAAQLREEADQ